MQKVKCCGEIIGSGTRQPDPEKVLAIKETVVPDTKKQLTGMLRLFSYFRKYVPSSPPTDELTTMLQQICHIAMPKPNISLLGCGKFLSVGGDFVVQQVVEELL